MTDTFELEKQIRMKGFTKKHVAQQLGLSPYGFERKLRNETEFKASEIKKLETLLQLPDNSLFFAKDVN